MLSESLFVHGTASSCVFVTPIEAQILLGLQFASMRQMHLPTRMERTTSTSISRTLQVSCPDLMAEQWIGVAVLFVRGSV